MNTKEIRIEYINSLTKESDEDIIKEFRQLILDVLDITEQTDIECLVIDAFNALENSILNEKQKSGWNTP